MLNAMLHIYKVCLKKFREIRRFDFSFKYACVIMICIDYLSMAKCYVKIISVEYKELR